ncbi:hypoxic response protein Hrp1 [Rugosimonospora acidiphila]|uniref:Hypoxic response protein Hrp1 n=1 Tax=Rugosimonospora acidiphila TaxID=556531 RepID=A0ABP9RMX7_9ACTN
MTTAREIMHSGVKCVGENEALAVAARAMRDLHVGAVPICGTDGSLRGIVTDRDIVVRCVAEGADPKVMLAGELSRGTPVTVDADADITEALRLMEDNTIRRIPVLDEQRMVGIISEADIVTNLTEREVQRFTAAVYSAPPTT